MPTSLEFIKALTSGEASEAKDMITNLLSGVAFEALDNKKQELAQSVFNSQEPPDVNESLDESKDSSTKGMKLVHKYDPEGKEHSSRVYFDKDWDDHQVHHYKNGKHMGEGPVSYHGDDKKEAIATSKYETDKMNKGIKEDKEPDNDPDDYSASKAKKGEDIGKPGKNFSKIASKAGKEYGSKEAGKKVAGAILAKLRKENTENLEEKADDNYEIYHPHYSSAVQHALEHTKKKGYDINDDDVWDNISTGPKKPSEGHTNKIHIPLSKNGKPHKKALHIQVYNRGTEKNPYELNKYIS